MKKSLSAFYFPHDQNARNDERLLMLRSEYGLEAYAIFWMILESMSSASTGEINREAIGGLSLSYGVAKERLTEIIDYCVRIGLFKQAKAGAIISTRMKENLAHRNILKEAGKRGAEKRWSVSQKNSHPNSHPSATPIAGEKRREENRIEEERIEEDIPLGITPIKSPGKLIMFFIEGLRKTNPAFAQKFPKGEWSPRFDKWEEDIEKILRLDHATEEQIEFVIRWLFEEDSKDSLFWRKNIQSGSTLREQFVRLVGVIKTSNQTKKPGFVFIS